MNGITRVNNELERKWKEADKMKFNEPSWYFPGQTWGGGLQLGCYQSQDSNQAHIPNTSQQLNQFYQLDEYVPIMMYTIKNCKSQAIRCRTEG